MDLNKMEEWMNYGSQSIPMGNNIPLKIKNESKSNNCSGKIDMSHSIPEIQGFLQ